MPLDLPAGTVQVFERMDANYIVAPDPAVALEAKFALCLFGGTLATPKYMESGGSAGCVALDIVRTASLRAFHRIPLGGLGAWRPGD